VLTQDEEKRKRRLKKSVRKENMPQDDPVTRVSKYQSKLVYDAEAEIALMSKRSLESIFGFSISSVPSSCPYRAIED
jgi:hypothetical protein